MRLVKALSEPTKFDWDEGNINKNFIKHNVTDKEAEEIFQNDPKFLLEDPKHSEKENRNVIWGITNKNRQLVISFTFRRERIRVISARAMNRKERRGYEEKTKTDSKI